MNFELLFFRKCEPIIFDSLIWDRRSEVFRGLILTEGTRIDLEAPCSIETLNFIFQMMKWLREVSLATHAVTGGRVHACLIETPVHSVILLQTSGGSEA